MPTVAEQMRQAREAQNLTIYQVAEITKIRTDHIRALESGEYGIFSAPVYVRGFVRTYARLLKLDVPTILAELNQELTKFPKLHEPPPLTTPSGGFLDSIMFQLSKLNWRVAGPVLGIVIAVIIGFFALKSMAYRKAHPAHVSGQPGIYQPAKKTQGDTLPLQPPAQQRHEKTR